jgi:predicted DCC family thiol-disulfide oxidoreductase YuxK
MTRSTTIPGSTPPDVVFFDGVCGLCNRSVDFILRHDGRGRFRFAPLQGEHAARELPPSDAASMNSLVLQRGGVLYRRSAAVVRILWGLGGFWKLLGGLLWLVPLPLRDLGYRAVSACRYRLWGKKETCRIPTADERSRFLD